MKNYFIKSVIIFSIFISIATMFSSCGNSVSEEQLIGTWIYTNSVSTSRSVASYSYGYKFDKDGTYIFVRTTSASIGGDDWFDSSNKITGTYSISGNKVSLKKDSSSKSIAGSVDSFKITEITSKEFTTDTGFTYKKS